ncbi:MAG TPA: alpha/beta hydrolase [Gemmatimonadaceae bacterium]|nr:alpha/beta hydrolase [Gemmatimonadaceae bacterium]
MTWLVSTLALAAFGGVLIGYDRWKRRAVARRYPAAGAHVTARGVSVHVLVRGEGRPVVMLHGNYGDSSDFSGRLRERVSRDFRAVIIDRPGYGHSERPPEGLSLSAQAEIIRDVVRQLGVEHPMLVAHSWSGFLALAYAVEHGDELAGLVLLNPLCYADETARRTDPHGHPLQRAADTLTPVVQPLVGYRVYRATMRSRFAPEPVPETEATDPLLAFRRARPAQRQVRDEDFEASYQSAGELAGRYASLTLPLVIVVGDGDRVAVPSRQGYRLHNQVHHSRLIVLPHAGHMIHITRPDAVMDAIHQAWQMAEMQDGDRRRPTPPKMDGVSGEFIVKS